MITYAEEEERVAVFWTAVGTNRVGLFEMPPTFKRSTFSGTCDTGWGTKSPMTPGSVKAVAPWRLGSGVPYSARRNPLLLVAAASPASMLIPITLGKHETRWSYSVAWVIWASKGKLNRAIYLLCRCEPGASEFRWPYPGSD